MKGRIFHLGLLLGLAVTTAQAQLTFRYFYDGNSQLFRVLDSTGNLVEYIYDLTGNPTQINRSVIPGDALSILNFVPQRGTAGQTVTIYGQNFGSTPGANLVKFNGTVATVTSASATVLVVQAPNGVTTGPVTVTVNGATVSSGSLIFTVPPPAQLPPVIISITPPTGFIGQTLTGVVVQGTSLDGALFSFGGGVITNVNAGSTQATFNLAIGQVTGPFTLIANTDSGTSSSQPTAGNTFTVFFPPGDNFAFLKFSVFNTNYPLGFTPNVPAGSNEVDRRFSTYNSFYPPGFTPNVPPGSNEANRRFSTFNTSFTTGANPFIPTGSNEAFQLFSTKNNSAMGPVSPMLSISGAFMGADSRGLTPGLNVSRPGTAQEPTTLIAGQTVRIAIGSLLSLTRFLEFQVNGVPLAASSDGSLDVLFTVPYGADSLDLKAAGRTDGGLQSDSVPQRVRVIRDPGRSITGRVVDEAGQPVAGATVTWQANGLAAEYYRFNQPVINAPDLAGLEPARTGYVSALNYPNPRQMFGKDPIGVELGQYYAARFHGKISVDTDGVYQFLLRAHAGARLRIDGQTLAETIPATGEFSDAAASVTLTAGPHDVEVVYYESAGASTLELFWTKPGGLQEIVSPQALQADALSTWTAVTGDDGRFTLRVPAALDGVQVKTRRGSVALDP